MAGDEAVAGTRISRSRQTEDALQRAPKGQ